MKRMMVLAVVLASSTATADSYRTQIVIADGASAATLGTGIALGTWVYSSEDFHLPMMIGAFGGAGIMLGAPIVHIANGELWRGASSFGLRLFVPAVVGATLVTAAGLEERDNGYDAYFFGGMALGAGVAVALDWWLLVPDRRTRVDAWIPAPVITPTQGGGTFGLAGAW